jgi:hypothetical protein
MINVLFYGNCQSYAVFRTLNLPTNYNIKHIACWKTNITEEEFKNTIIESNIIITQPINDNYRDSTYLSTSFIIKHKNSNCKLIIFDSCYFNFYYFDLTYKMFNNDVLHKPIDYHYNGMIECYNTNKSIEYYIDNFVNNMDLKSSEELDELAQISLNELKVRYERNKEKYNDNAHIIQTYDYIERNYKDKLLFYSMNHPSKYLIQYICEQIVDFLQIQNTINYNIDDLSDTKCILYKCISKNVNFDINNHSALTLNNTDIHKITQLYYNTYSEIGFK